MQALVYTDTQTLIYREEKNPKLLNGESIIKVSASGICGSDMHAYHGHDNRRIPPLILGHEVSGVINKGKDIGKKVVLNPLITCGKCNYCTNKREHLCPKRVILGMNRPIERQGGFAEYVSIPDKNIYELPKNLNMKEAPIAEPCAVALHAVELGENELSLKLKDSKALVIGSGAIGLLSGLILSKVKKCKEIVIVEPNDKESAASRDFYKAEPYYGLARTYFIMENYEKSKEYSFLASEIWKNNDLIEYSQDALYFYALSEYYMGNEKKATDILIELANNGHQGSKDILVYPE